MPADCALARWSKLLQEAAVVLTCPLDTCGRAKEMILEAGFVDVVKTPFRWPQNEWPKEDKYKEIGFLTRENFTLGVEAMSLALLTRGLGWELEEVHQLVGQVRKDISDENIHAYWRLNVVYGRKP